MNKAYYLTAITAVVFIGVTGVVVIAVFGKTEQTFPIISGILGFLTSIIAAMAIAIHKKFTDHDTWEREAGGVASMKLDAMQQTLDGHSKTNNENARALRSMENCLHDRLPPT